MLTVVNADGTYSGVQYGEIRQEYIDHHTKQGQKLIWLERTVNAQMQEVEVGTDWEGKPVIELQPVVETATAEELSKLITTAPDPAKELKNRITDLEMALAEMIGRG